MTKDEMINIVENHTYTPEDVSAILTAVEEYTAALIAAKPIVSGSFCDCTGNETNKYYDDSGVKRCWECRKEAK